MNQDIGMLSAFVDSYLDRGLPIEATHHILDAAIYIMGNDHLRSLVT